MVLDLTKTENEEKEIPPPPILISAAAQHSMLEGVRS